MLYRLLAKLLDYPDAELMAAVPETRARLARSADLDATERRVVAEFLDHLSALELTEAQAAYVMTFDLTPEHALHLTHHLFGDDKNRGPALIDLTEFYKEYGLEVVSPGAGEAAGDAPNELPDFLPLMLEFADQLDLEEARMFLSQWTKVFKVLAGNLEETGSAYAPLIRLLEDRSQLVKAAA